MNEKNEDFFTQIIRLKWVFESNYVTVVVQIHVHRYSNKTKNQQNQNDCISKWKIIYKNCARIQSCEHFTHS